MTNGDQGASHQLPARIGAYLRRRFGSSASSAGVEALSGDASTRRYFRVRRGQESWVLVLYPEGSEAAQRAFAELRSRLAAWGLPVPALEDRDDERGLMLLGDLGDITLQERLRWADADEREALYRQAIDQLRVMQREALRCDGVGPGFDAAFDVEKLSWELEFFEEHFLGACRGIVLSSGEREALDEGFRWLSTVIASWERVLCHRDFHSRNLMWREGCLYWIDFQDARLGPLTYDLASLLRDAYVDLPESFVAERLGEYWQAAASREPREAFERRFELTCVQRNLKALGTFGYQAAARGNPVYLQYVPRTLAHARRNLCRHAQLAGVHAILERYLEDYRA